MSKYQQLYSQGVSESLLSSIKEALSSGHVLTWEEYYWGIKCLIKYDESEANPDLVIRSINNAFRTGLNLRDNRELYQDASKIISAFYCTFGKYNQAINHIQVYIDSLEDNAPDWAYHDLINAKIHTDQIDMMIENPSSFLDDLARNDESSDVVAERQKLLFRDFLLAAAGFIRDNPKIKVGEKAIVAAAEKYGLLESEAFQMFSAVIGYKGYRPPSQSKPEAKKPKEKGKSSGEQQAPTTTGQPSSGSQVGAKSDNESLKKKYEEIIAKLQKEIETRDATITTLQGKIRVCDNECAAIKADLSISRGIINELQAENLTTRTRLSKTEDDLRKSREEYQALLSKYSHGERGNAALQKEISDQNRRIKELKDSIDVINGKLKEAQDKCTSAEREKAQINSQLQNVLYEMQDLVLEKSRIQQELDQLKANYPDSGYEPVSDSIAPFDEYSVEEVYGLSWAFLNITCYNAGKEWLKRELPKVSKNYMETCFYPYLNNSEIMDKNDHGWSQIDDFDFLPIIRVILGNIDSSQSFARLRSSKGTVLDMKRIRNGYAHQKGIISNREAVKNIDTMIAFVYLMNGDKELADRMQDYADSIPV